MRRAEFGFLGVWVYTRVHTPRRWGAPLRAGVFVFEDFDSRPLRTSCAMVGTTTFLGSCTAPGARDVRRRAGRTCYGLLLCPANACRHYRRRTPDLADHAYGHCLAVLRTPVAAEEATAVGLRQGGRSLIGVLAHSRYQALHAAAQGTDRPSDASEADAAPADVSDLAWALAATRPALEVAVVDLDTRHGLRRVGLGRSLGLAPAAAADRATAIAAAWEAELDPALMAWMGPGDCEELGTILEDLGPESSVADLLAVAGVVAEHSRALRGVRRPASGHGVGAVAAGPDAATGRSRRDSAPSSAGASTGRSRPPPRSTPGPGAGRDGWPPP